VFRSSSISTSGVDLQEESAVGSQKAARFENLGCLQSRGRKPRTNCKRTRHIALGLTPRSNGVSGTRFESSSRTIRGGNEPVLHLVRVSAGYPLQMTPDASTGSLYSNSLRHTWAVREPRLPYGSCRLRSTSGGTSRSSVSRRTRSGPHGQTTGGGGVNPRPNVL
jgi:hypothetical protein